MNFIYGPHTRHTVACHAPRARTPTCVWTTSVSISCYRLFPPNLHTQNNLTVQRRYSMPAPFHTYHAPVFPLSLFSPFSPLSVVLSLWAATASPQAQRDLCAAPINFHLVSQLGLPVSLSLPLLPLHLSLSHPLTSAFH